MVIFPLNAGILSSMSLCRSRANVVPAAISSCALLFLEYSRYAHWSNSGNNVFVATVVVWMALAPMDSPGRRAVGKDQDMWLCWRNCFTGSGHWGGKSPHQGQSLSLSLSLPCLWIKYEAPSYFSSTCLSACHQGLSHDDNQLILWNSK